MTIQADAAIVGGGIAGIAAAVELLNRNKTVVILERGALDQLGGLAQWAFGGIFLVNTPYQRKIGVYDTPDLALRDWNAYAEFGPSDVWPRKWAEYYVNQCREDVYEWLVNLGLRFLDVFWVERGLYLPGNSVPRFHMVYGTGRKLVDVLCHELKNHRNHGRLKLLFKHRVTGLSTKNGCVNGCIGHDEEADREFSVESQTVIIAAGGVTGNLEFVRKNWSIADKVPPDVLLSGSHEEADGYVHKLVENIGGNITHIDKMWNYAAGIHHPTPRHRDHGLSLIPPKTALWVNYKGCRIGDPPLITGFDTSDLVNQICTQKHKYSWQILNHRIAVRELGVSGSEFNDVLVNPNLLRLLKLRLCGNQKLVNRLLRSCRDFVVANSLDELVERMNTLNEDSRMSLAELREEVKAFDANIGRGRLHNDDQLRRIDHLNKFKADRWRITSKRQILDPRSGPLIAIREFIITRKSLGGIQTDTKCRILRPNGDFIPGLYAVGESAGFGGGGIHGNRALEGTFLGSCILSGRIAGQQAG